MFQSGHTCFNCVCAQMTGRAGKPQPFLKLGMSKSFTTLSFFFLHMEFELRSSLHACYTTWATLPDLFCVRYWGLNSGPTPWATPAALFLCEFFLDRVSCTISQSWLWTSILPISASSAARNIGVSNRHPAATPFFLWWVFSRYLPELALKLDPPALCLLSN
jgi:hypothetical protein